MIEFPDVSHWQGKLTMTGAKALTAKLTEGTSFYDPTFLWYAAQAHRLAIPFLPYHFLTSTNPQNQAAHAAGVIGGGGPLMLDIETAADGTFPTIATTKAFITAYPGRVTLAYIPRWFWAQHWGSADLTWLTEMGIGLISSDYNTTPPDGWAPYGGVTPVIWQYTATGVGWGSTNLDMNRFKGTTDQLAHVFNGTTPAPVTPEEDPMKIAFLIEPSGTCHLWWLSDSGPWYMTIDRAGVLDGLRTACGTPPSVNVTAEDVTAGRWGRKYTPTTPPAGPSNPSAFQIALSGTANPTA